MTRVSASLMLNRDALTRSTKLAVETLSLDTLDTKTCTHESQSDEGFCVGPGRKFPLESKTGLSTLPESDSGRHGEENLDEHAAHQPDAFVWTDLVP